MEVLFPMLSNMLSNWKQNFRVGFLSHGWRRKRHQPVRRFSVWYVGTSKNRPAAALLSTQHETFVNRSPPCERSSSQTIGSYMWCGKSDLQ